MPTPPTQQLRDPQLSNADGVILALMLTAVVLAFIGCLCIIRVKWVLRKRMREGSVNSELLQSYEGEGATDATDSFSKRVGYDALKQSVSSLMGGLHTGTGVIKGAMAPGTIFNVNHLGQEDFIGNEKADDLTIGEVIGKGTYGIVYRGTYHEKLVAVKVMVIQDSDYSQPQVMDQIIGDFTAEVQIQAMLNHPNIVSLLGFTTKPNVTIIQQYISGGNLHELLREKEQPIPLAQRLGIALDTAVGMRYLHSREPPLIHRDLKSPNLLLTKDFRVKITDFGLARIKARGAGDHTAMMTQCGTPYWTAPEILKGEMYNERVDVYSFGIVLLELWSRTLPFEGLQPMDVALKVVHQNMRPSIPDGCGCPILVLELIQRCWAQDSSMRPSFVEVVDTLRAIARSGPSHEGFDVATTAIATLEREAFDADLD